MTTPARFAAIDGRVRERLTGIEGIVVDDNPNGDLVIVVRKDGLDVAVVITLADLDAAGSDEIALDLIADRIVAQVNP